MTTLAQMKTDMTTFLATWAESMSRQRVVVTYDSENKPTETWTTSPVTISGDYQPLSGSDERNESGRTDKSDGKVFTEFDTDILAGDRLVRSSVYWHVNYVKDFEDHLEIFIRKLRNG